MRTDGRRDPPGPDGLPVIGNTRELAGDRLAFMTETAREYGDVTRIDFVGDRALYGLFHPDHVRQVLVENNQQYVKGEFFQDRLELLGNGLLNAEGEEWRRQRHQVESAFHPDRIAGYGETMVEYTERRLERWELPTVTDLHEEMMGVTLEIVADALFDVDIRAAESDIGDALGTVMENFRRRTGRPVDIPRWVPTGNNRRYSEARETLTAIVGEIIAQKRGDEDGGDVVSMLLRSEDEQGRGMDPETIGDQVLTLLLAGHECYRNWTPNSTARRRCRTSVRSPISNASSARACVSTLPFPESSGNRPRTTLSVATAFRRARRSCSHSG